MRKLLIETAQPTRFRQTFDGVTAVHRGHHLAIWKSLNEKQIGAESAFPAVSDEERHHRQDPERAERQGAGDGMLSGEVLAQREAMQRQDDHAFHQDHEAKGDGPDSKPDHRQGRQGESIDHPLGSDDHGQKNVRGFHEASDQCADMESDHFKSNDFQHEASAQGDEKVDGSGFQDFPNAVRPLVVTRSIEHGTQKDGVSSGSVVLMGQSSVRTTIHQIILRKCARERPRDADTVNVTQLLESTCEACMRQQEQSLVDPSVLKASLVRFQSATACRVVPHGR